MFDPPFPPPKPAIIRAADAALLRPRLLVPAERSRAVLPGILALPMAAGAAAAAAAAISHVAYQGITDDLTTYTFSDLAFGEEAEDRRLVMFVSGRSNASRSINSASIGGVSASNVVTATVTGASTNQSRGAIRIAAVPTGTSGDVVVTFSGSMLRAAVSLYRIVGLSSSTANNTANGSIGGTGNSGDKTLQIDVPAGGVMLAGAAGFGTQNSFSAAGMTTDFTNTTIESSYRMSAGHGRYLAQQTGLTVTVNLASNHEELLFLAASWAPAS